MKIKSSLNFVLLPKNIRIITIKHFFEKKEDGAGPF